MKNQLGIIIQGTTAGLNNIYISSNLDVTNKGIVETLKDERILAAQIANQSNVYSVQTINDYKVYSLIITNITDFTGRSGYYAIKLYSKINFKVKNVVALLNQINDRYIAYKESSDLNNQDYNNILEQANNQIQNTIISNKLISTAYVRYHENIEININNDIVYAVEKLYLFDHEKALNEEQINAQGLINFENFQKQVKPFQVNNSAGVLKKLIVNGNELNQVRFPDSFTSFRQKDDAVTFFTNDDTNIKQAIFDQNNIFEVKRKITIPHPPKPPIGGNRGTTKQKDATPTQKVLIVGLVLGFGIGLYLFLTQPVSSNPPPGYTPGPIVNKKDSSTFKFTETSINIEHLAFKNASIYTSNYNNSLSERLIVKKQETDTCFIVKIENLNNPGPGNLNKSDFDKPLGIKGENTEIFIKELLEKCGCKVYSKKEEPVIKKVNNIITKQNPSNNKINNNTKPTSSDKKEKNDESEFKPKDL